MSMNKPLETEDSSQNRVVSLTEAAVAKVRSLMAREHGETVKSLRISIVGGGCSGFSYKMGFEDAASEKDHVFEERGLQVLVDQKSALFLKGLEIDFQDGLNGAGFTYENPQAKKSCGCGTSFSVA